MVDFTANFTLSELESIDATFVIETGLTQDQIDKINIIKNTGNGSKFLADDGTYKAGAGGVSDYDDLTNRPQINSIILTGNKTAADLSLATTTDLSSKVDKVIGKSLISDTEITRLASVDNYTLPTASNSVLGGVKVDNSTIIITNGVISASSGSTIYHTSDTLTSYAGQWTKLATIDLTAQGQSISVASLNIARMLDGVLKEDSICIDMKISQESQLANAPTISFNLCNKQGQYFDGGIIVLTLDENSVTKTTLSLYVRAWQNNTQFFFIPLLINNDGATITFLNDQPYIGSVSVYRYANSETVNAGTFQVNNTSVIDPYGFIGSGERVTRLQYAETRESASGSPVEGMFYFNTTDKHFYGYNGTTWKQLDN